MNHNYIHEGIMLMNKFFQVPKTIRRELLKLLRFIKHQLLYNVFLSQHQFVIEHLIDAKKRNRYFFEKNLKRPLNIENPELYNDKIQWLKFNWYSPIASIVVDKFEVRSYVSELIGKSYLNGLIGVFNSVDDINFESLPSMFAIKATHGSGFNIICTDKLNLNWERAQKRINLWLKTKYYLLTHENVYKGTKPRLIVEEFISDDYEKGINDYKFFAFHGVIGFLYLSYKTYDSHGNMSKTRRYFTPDWKEISTNESGEVIFIETDTFKPPFIDKMITVSEILARPFPHVRVDLYFEKSKIMFGELTFFHQNGMEQFPSLAFEYWVSQFLDLEKVKQWR